MKNRHIINLASTGQSLKSVINVEYMINYLYDSLSETLIWEYYTRYGSAFYKIDTANTHEITFHSTSRKVSSIYDPTLSGNNSYQSDDNLKPISCDKSNRINNRYYITFDGINDRMISDINLNKQPSKSDIVNVFIVYRLKTDNSNGYWCINSLFGIDDGGFDRFISFGAEKNSISDLVISGTVNDHIVIGVNNVNGKTPIANYQTNANAGETGVFHCLSVHWDVDAGVNGSSVYINGEKIATFQDRTSSGSQKLCFGNLNPAGATESSLDGDLAAFLLYRNRMDERSIKLHHKVLCTWYDVPHDEIIF